MIRNIAAEQAALGGVIKLEFTAIEGAYDGRTWHGYLIRVGHVHLGNVRVWRDGVVEIWGSLFDDNPRLTQMVRDICVPKLRVVK